MKKLLVKLSDEQKQRLKCLCGNCDHDWLDGECVFNKIINAKNQEEEIEKQFLALINDVFLDNVNNMKNQKCGKIKSESNKEVDGQ